MNAPADGKPDLEQPAPGARYALALLLAINLFNYIDRQVLSAVLPKMKRDAALFSPTDEYLNFKLGALTTAFMLSYMVLSPIFGWLGDRGSRWIVVGIALLIWSLATGGSGWAATFWILLLTRCCVGVGEAAYGPVAPAMLSDMFPQSRRGRLMSYFYLAIPVGSALGFVIGGLIADHWGWRNAFQVVMIPGLVLGIIALFMRDRRPPRTVLVGPSLGYFAVLRRVFRVPSWIINSIAYTFITFVLGGVAAWVPEYLFERESLTQPTAAAVAKLAAKRDTDGKPAVPPEVIAKLRPLESKEVEKGAIFRQKLKDALTQPEFILYGSTIEDALAAPHSPTLSELDLIFGLIVVVGGLLATLAGGVLGDRLRARYPGSYFLVSGWGALLSVPFFAGMLLLPLPLAWLSLFVAVFGLFLNTGPSSTILANVVPVEIRGSSFAINIFIIHAFGDAISPALIGRVADVSNLQTAFLMCTVMIAAGGVIWLLGSKHLQRDTERAAELLK